MTAAALFVALASALCYALAAALQQHAAEQAETLGGAQLMAYLLTRPRWLAGAVAMATGACLHVLALTLGPLALVQPIGVTGLVFALPVGAALRGHRVGRRQVFAAAAVALGLAVLLGSLNVAARPPTLTTTHGFVLAGVTLAAVLGCALLGQRLRERTRAIAYAVGAGIAFGVTSALISVIAAGVGMLGLVPALLDWPTLLMLTCAATGLTLAQSAYQVGSLPSVLPTLTVIDPIAAVTVGALLLGEPLRLSRAGSMAAGASLAVIVTGTVLLARYQRLPARVTRLGHLPGRHPRGTVPGLQFSERS